MLHKEIQINDNRRMHVARRFEGLTMRNHYKKKNNNKKKEEKRKVNSRRVPTSDIDSPSVSLKGEEIKHDLSSRTPKFPYR
jgi:hypothetical protein